MPKLELITLYRASQFVAIWVGIKELVPSAKMVVVVEKSGKFQNLECVIAEHNAPILAKHNQPIRSTFAKLEK